MKLRCFLFTLVALTALHQAAFAITTFTAKVATGRWDLAGSWTQAGTVDGDGIPDNNDDIIIPNGATINFTGAALTLSVNNATIQAGGVLNLNAAGATLQIFNSGAALIVDGQIQDNSTGTIIEFVYTGTGTAAFNTGATAQCDQFQFNGNGQTVTISGAGTVSTGRFFVLWPGITVHLNTSGTFQSNTSAFNVSAANFTIDGTGTLLLSNNLNLSASGFSVACTITIAGDLAIIAASSSMTVANLGTVNIGDDLRLGPAPGGPNSSITIASGGQILGSSDVLVSESAGGGNNFAMINAGTFSITGSTTVSNAATGLSFQNSGTMSMTNMTLVAASNNWSIQNSGTATFTGSIDVTATSTNFAVTNAGIFNLNGSFPNSPSVNPATFTNNSGGTFNLGGDLSNNLTLTASASNNTVNYNSNGGTDIEAPVGNNYHHLIVGSTSNRLQRAAINVLGNLTIQGTAILNTNGFDINLTGNWSNTSNNADPFVEGTRTVSFVNTTAAQTISNTGDSDGTFFNNVVFNNTFTTPPQLTINNAVTVASQLTMTSGVVNLNSTTFTLGTAIATPGTLVHSLASTAGWMYGGNLVRFFPTTAVTAVTAAGLFPMGSATNWRPYYLGKTNTGSSGGSYQVSHTNATTSTYLPPSPIADDVNIIYRHNAFWTGTVLSGITAGTFSLTAGGTGFGTVTNVADLRLCRIATVVGSPGVNSGITSSPLVNRITLSAANLTNNFYIGSTTTSSVLPITLLDFRASGSSDVVTVDWSTATELNNDYFNVERSADGQEFQSISKVEGAGTSTEPRSYSITDERPLVGLGYYRLKQTDYNGLSSYSKIVSINSEFDQERVTIYPIPAKAGDDVHIKIVNQKTVDSNTIGLRLSDLNGRAIAVEYESKGNNSFVIHPSIRPTPGLYVLQVRLPDWTRSYVQKIYFIE